MPRGRPPGSKNKPKEQIVKTDLLADSKSTLTNNEKPAQPKTMAVTSIQKEEVKPKLNILGKYTYKCEICEQVFPGSPTPMDFTQLTGKADYYRESKSKKLYICNECSLELSDLVDNWIQKKNPKLLKFPVKCATDS